MTTIVVLFNLKPGVDREDYEAWAKQTDLPIVNGLGSVDKFRIQRAVGLFGSDEPAPYQYFEFIEVNDMEGFGADVGSETIQSVAAEFQQFADSPVFVVTEALS